MEHSDRMLSVFSLFVSLTILFIIAFRAFRECGCQLHVVIGGSGPVYNGEGSVVYRMSYHFRLENIGQHSCKNITATPLYELYVGENLEEIGLGTSNVYNHILPGKHIDLHIKEAAESPYSMRPIGVRVEYKMFGFIPRKRDVMKQEGIPVT